MSNGYLPGCFTSNLASADNFLKEHNLKYWGIAISKCLQRPIKSFGPVFDQRHHYNPDAKKRNQLTLNVGDYQDYQRPSESMAVMCGCDPGGIGPAPDTCNLLP